MSFVSITPEQLQQNVFSAIGKQWMLITAGGDTVNTMTASWGGLGVLWNKPVAFIFVRPSRHTYGFLEQNETFSLGFFAEEHRAALQLCGKVSGRDVDKIAQCGFTVCRSGDTPYFEQSELVLCCRKLYFGDIDPARFGDASIAACYPGDTDYHRVYIAEIEQILQRG
jgi:flavin reductase (DIM6/NTAB) family NADH-FMN oxidoreductase RutF